MPSIGLREKVRRLYDRARMRWKMASSFIARTTYLLNFEARIPWPEYSQLCYMSPAAAKPVRISVVAQEEGWSFVAFIQG